MPDYNKELIYAYTAGFFDGEGCIRIDDNRTLLTCLTNTNLEILIKLKKEFGGNIRVHGKTKSHHKDSWIWGIADRSSLKKFIETILPYSTVKKQQLEYGLKYLELTSNSQHGRVGLSSEESKIREFFSCKLQEMKHIELSDNELNMYINELKNMTIDKNQQTMEDF